MAKSSSETVADQQAESEFERGRAHGYIEGQSAEREDSSAKLRRMESEKIEHALRLNELFASERERYIQSIEPEVVKLALAVASLILRHEVQIDPLLLTGSVRIALRGIAARTSVKICVPAATADLWVETLDHLPNLAAKPTVVADDSLQDGECTLETEMGSVDLGVQSQLAEITRALASEQRGQQDQHSCGTRIKPTVGT
jgi:flagellar assembly protein FliH